MGNVHASPLAFFLLSEMFEKREIKLRTIFTKADFPWRFCPDYKNATFVLPKRAVSWSAIEGLRREVKF
jgi:hypothetical protein